MRIHTVFPHIVSAETILFLNLEIQRSQYIRAKVTVHKCAETICRMRKYGTCFGSNDDLSLSKKLCKSYQDGRFGLLK